MTESDRVAEAVAKLLAAYPPAATEATAFLGAQFDAGLAWVHFPPGCGGLGVDRALQRVVDERLRAAGAPERARMDTLGAKMGAPTVLTHGTGAQRERYLRAAFTTRERWCQLFSEPGSGSDLASVATRAVRDGDGWIVNGQKVWSSFAQASDLGMLLARSHPDVPKHRGLTFFVIDMRTPGIEVRPLRQITGESEFNEVFLTDVRVPDDARLGPAGEGWRVAMTTLMSERAMYGDRGLDPMVTTGAVACALAVAARTGPLEPDLQDRLVDLWRRGRALDLTNRRLREEAPDGMPGPEASVGKIGYARLQQAGYELCLDLLGADALVTADTTGADVPLLDPHYGFLRSRANSIEGGTSEIMHNILAERVLGLPADRRDRDVPWSQTLRN